MRYRQARLWDNIAYGLIITATNPKVALIWASLSTLINDAALTLPLLLLFAGVSATILFTIYGAYGLLFSLGHIRQLHDRFNRVSMAIFGSIFAMIGVGMMIHALGDQI